MDPAFSMNLLKMNCVVLLFLFLVQGDTCAGQELSQGGDAPVTIRTEFKNSFQPVLKGPTQEEQDFKAAEYLFVQGRILESENRKLQALQCYERACQYVSSDTILVCIVTLAFELKHYDEAFVYFDKIQNPGLLGFQTLTELSVVFERLDDDSRKIKTLHTILNLLPANAPGPMRLMLRNCLGISEYVMNHYSEARTSFLMIRKMLKDPTRYGIQEKDVLYFKENEISNLYALLDIAIHDQNAEEAHSYLNTLFSLQEKKLEEEEGLSEEERKERRTQLQLGKTFDSARIAYIEKDAETALKLAKEAYFAGYTDETPCYSLLKNILDLMERPAEYFETLKELQKKFPEDPVILLSLAEELEKQAQTFPEEAKRKEMLEQAQVLYEKLFNISKESLVCIQILKIAMIQNDPERVLKYGRILNESYSLEDYFGTFDEILQSESSLEDAAPSEASPVSTTQNAENTESAKSAKDTENEENVEDEEDTESLFPTQEQVHLFAQNMIQYAGQNYNSEEKKKNLDWTSAWILCWMANECGEKDAFEEYLHLAAAEVLECSKASSAPQPQLDSFFSYWGNRSYNEKNYSTSEFLFQQAMNMKSDQHMMYALMSVETLRVQNTKPEDAWKILLDLEKQDPENWMVQLFKSEYLLSAGKTDEAKGILLKLLTELDNNFSSEFNREVMQTIRKDLSNIEDENSNFDGAIEHLQRILDEFPEDSSTMNSLAYLWACKNTNLQRALRYSEQTLQSDPKNAMYLDTLGWIYYRLGNYEKALETLNQAVETLEDPVVFSHLGDVYLALNQKEKAVQYFKQSLQQFQELGRKNQTKNKDLEHVQAQLNLLKVS